MECQFLIDLMVLLDRDKIQVKFLKGKKMAGHMGDKLRTVLNLK